MAAAEFEPAQPEISAPIDTIAIKMPAGYNMMPPDEWQALHEEQRFNLIKAKRVAFLSAGVSIPVRPALRWLADHAGGNDEK